MKKNPVDNFIDYFFSLSPYELAFIANILGTVFSIPLDVNQQNTLGNFFELIGQQILLIQAQGSNLLPNSVNQIDFNNILRQINFKFEYLEELIDYLKNKKD